MSLIMLPAIGAFTLKLWLLATANRRPWAGEKWIGFVAIFAMHNLNEILLLSGAERGWDLAWLLRGYYVATLMAMSYGLKYIVDERVSIQRLYFQACMVCAIGLIGIIIFTDSVVYGYTAVSYSVAAFKGSGFIYFKVVALAHLIGGLGFLIYNCWYWASRDVERYIDYIYTLVGLLPLILFGVALVLLLQKGIGANALVVVPICSTFFLMATLKGKNVRLLNRDIRAMVPFTLEADLQSQLNSVVTQYRFGNYQHTETMAKLERDMLIYQLRKRNWNISRTASDLGLPRSTLYSMLDRFGIYDKNHDDSSVD